MLNDLIEPPAKPCGSCPYRKDVPSGIWHPSEYEKLPAYDGEIIEQVQKGAFGLFMCHQQDGKMCGGWLACHGPENLLALRMSRGVAPEAHRYETSVPVFQSGAEARQHGLRDIAKPDVKAGKMIAGLVRKKAARGRL